MTRKGASLAPAGTPGIWVNAINLIVEKEIKRKQLSIRKFGNLPDSDILLDKDFWTLLPEGNKVEIIKHLRKTNKTEHGYLLDIHECTVIVEALRYTV